MANDNDLIRRGDAFAVVKGLRLLEEDIRNLPAVMMGVKPLEWHQTSTEPARWLGHQADVSNPDYVIHLTADSPDVFAWGLDGDGWHGFCDTLDAAKAAAKADYEARILAALEPVAAPDPAVIREAWERSYWRLRSYAVHDNDCKLNKPPRFDGPCSCGLTAALEEALALLTEKPHDRA